MVAVLMVAHGGGAWLGNLSLLIVCLTLATSVHLAAPAVHALRGWRKVGANVVMTIVAVLAMAWASAPHLVQAKTFAMIECVCYWGWEAWCCYY